MGQIWSAVIDPTTTSTIYALTGYGPSGLWKSMNAGVDWDQTFPADTDMPGFVERVSMDPTNSAHLVVSFHADCSPPHTPACLGETKDGGVTWNIVDFPSALEGAAGEGTGVILLNATTWLYTSSRLYYTADAGMTWAVAASSGVGVTLFQTPNGAYYLGAGGGVITSCNGASWMPIANSGTLLDAVVGDGSRLFAFAGFYAPTGSNFIWSATYGNPASWTVLSTPGLPAHLTAGANGASYDTAHHLMYAAVQSEGLWRVVTR
jgi:hypothetical protein